MSKSILNVRFWLFSFILVFSVLQVFAQDEGVVVERSRNKVSINGQIYYVHVVKAGQTIYSISKAYNISQKDLTLENPEVTSGLKEGQILKIPEQPAIIEKSQIIKSDDYIYHIVEPGQTLYFISRKYNVPVPELIKVNPELEISSLQVDQVIKIPKKPAQSETEPEISDTISYIDHEVIKGETLYSLSQKYDVSVYEIQEANEDMGKHGLKAGNIIRIPVKPQIVTHQIPPMKDTLKLDTALNVVMNEPVGKNRCDSVQFDFQTKVFNIGLLMPLMLDYTDQEIQLIAGFFGTYCKEPVRKQ